MYITIDGVKCVAQEGEYILPVARRNNIYIPTLCHSDSLPGQANCRLCIVEVIEKGRNKVVVSCVFPVKEGIEVKTNTEKIRNMRKTIIKLLSARVPECEELKRLREEYGVQDFSRFKTSPEEKCILCGLCVRACDELGTSAISTINRGITKEVSTPYNEPSVDCIGCGACAYVCPTNAIEIEEAGGRRRIWNKEFTLIKCSRCGRYFITKEESEYINKKLDGKTNMDLCENCRRKLTTEKLMEVCKNTL